MTRYVVALVGLALLCAWLAFVQVADVVQQRLVIQARTVGML